jgi:hypothetical protein
MDVVKVVRDVARVDRMLHMFQWLCMYVSDVCSKSFIVSDVYCKCFHLHVVKVDMDVAYICMLQVYVSSGASVSSGCCICL